MDSKTPIDVTAAGSTGAVWMGMLPEMLTVIATGLTIIWFAIRIYETDTVKKIVARLQGN
jgi:hypothetical protein